MARTLSRGGFLLIVIFGGSGLVGLFGSYVGLSYNRGPGAFVSLGIAGWLLWRWRRGNAEADRREKIVEGGVQGIATVVMAKRIQGWTDRDAPKLSMRLRLDVPGSPARQIEHEEQLTVYAANAIKPGLRLPVVLDPKDPGSVVLVW